MTDTILITFEMTDSILITFGVILIEFLIAIVWFDLREKIDNIKTNLRGYRKEQK